MYLGTKVKFRSTMLPQSFQNENFEEFKDFKKVERKKIVIPREKVAEKTSKKALSNIIDYVNKEFEKLKSDSYGVIKYIESNTIGNNTLIDVDHSIVISLYLYSKPKKKQASKEITK